MAVVMMGCNGQILDVGNDDGGAGASMGGASPNDAKDAASILKTTPICDAPVVDTPQAAWPDADACAAAAIGVQSEIVGVWEGHSEDVSFNPVKSYRLEILAASEGGAICGRLTFGEGTVPPLSDDPSALYPPWVGSRDTYQITVRNYSYPQLMDGATYTLVAGALNDSELRFRVSPNEQYAEWCSLQSSYRQSYSDSYNCNPEQFGASYTKGDRVMTSLNDETMLIQIGDVEVQYSTAQLALCNETFGVCACDSCHCTARNPEAANISNGEWPYNFDLTFNGDEATGTVFDDGMGPAAMTTAVLLRLNRVK
jgi:hypothetical protein